MAVISVRDLSKQFRGTTLYSGVSFDLEPGGTYGLAGPNGSGKSVLLKLLCGFLRPDAGEVRIDPAYLAGGRTFPDRFGVIIDGPAYLPGLSGERNLLELARIRGRVGLDEVRETLTAVGLTVGSKQRVRSYSSGMKQKLAIAQAIMENPAVLILDEPFNALDEASVAAVKSILAAEKARGTTILFTSHNRDDFDELCDQVLEVNAGTVRPR